jgi:hypothetical protein
VTGEEHYAEAERFARHADDFAGEPSPRHVQAARLAQVHATLALAHAHLPVTMTIVTPERRSS